MKKIVCILCPRGCNMEIDEKTLRVEGNTCKRGEKFAQSELTNPKRSISSTVKTIFKDYPVLPVKTSDEIPKDKIFALMEELKQVTVSQKIGRNDAIIKDVLNLGVDVIATSNILKEIKEN